MPCGVYVEWLQFNCIEPWGAPWHDYLHARSDFQYALSLSSKDNVSQLQFKDFLYDPARKKTKSNEPAPEVVQQQRLDWFNWLKGKAKKG